MKCKGHKDHEVYYKTSEGHWENNIQDIVVRCGDNYIYRMR